MSNSTILKLIVLLVAVILLCKAAVGASNVKIVVGTPDYRAWPGQEVTIYGRVLDPDTGEVLPDIHEVQSTLYPLKVGSEGQFSVVVTASTKPNAVVNVEFWIEQGGDEDKVSCSIKTVQGQYLESDKGQGSFSSQVEAQGESRTQDPCIMRSSYYGEVKVRGGIEEPWIRIRRFTHDPIDSPVTLRDHILPGYGNEIATWGQHVTVVEGPTAHEGSQFCRAILTPVKQYEWRGLSLPPCRVRISRSLHYLLDLGASSTLSVPPSQKAYGNATALLTLPGRLQEATSTPYILVTAIASQNPTLDPAPYSAGAQNGEGIVESVEASEIVAGVEYFQDRNQYGIVVESYHEAHDWCDPDRTEQHPQGVVSLQDTDVSLSVSISSPLKGM